MNRTVEVPFRVQEGEGLRVDSYLSQRLHRYSRAQVQRMITEGRVLLRGRRAKAAAKVIKGDTVIIRYTRAPEPPPVATSLSVVFEDDRLLAVNKTAGVLSHPTDKVFENTVTTILARQFPDLKLHLAHRLDRETSGVLLLAKDPAAAKDVFEQFVARSVKKEYLALASGKVAWKRRSVEAPLEREGLEIKVRMKVGGGDPARTEFERLGVGSGVSLIRAFPKTGRLHQIRVHLAHLGHPVIGDKLYIGAGEAYMKAVRKELTPEDTAALGASRQMLHAWKMGLRSPAGGRRLTFTAPPPEDFAARAREEGLKLP